MKMSVPRAARKLPKFFFVPAVFLGDDSFIAV